MADNKTKPTKESVAAFLGAIPDERRRKDCRTVATMMRRATGEPPKMWGASIVGFGRHQYKYASGREGEMPLTGFAPRRNDVTLYIMGGFPRYATLMAALGKYTNGKSCLHIKKLDDVDLDVLEDLVGQSVEHMTRRKSGEAR